LISCSRFTRLAVYIIDLHRRTKVPLEEDGSESRRRIEPKCGPEAQAINAQLRQPSVADLLRKIETLEARLESAPECDPVEEQKRSKRSADAANVAHARWEKREQAPDSNAPAVDGTLPA